MSYLLTYQQVLEQTAHDKKRTLLLGNGFSIACEKDRFSFTSLLDSAVKEGITNEEDPIYKIFTEFDTKDFETVINLLETSSEIVKKYDAISPKDEARINGDALRLKEHLVAIITNNHPEKITDIDELRLLNCANFLSEYDRVYTLNYDLLLYWACIKLMEQIKDNQINSRLNVTDGFEFTDDGSSDNVIYADNSQTHSIHYLHGALHLFDNKYEIIKHTYSENSITLKEQTLSSINQGIYPIFVSEGTSKQKKEKIIHNAYLNHCYKSLSKIGDSLIIFGTTLKQNDEHIKEAIKNNKVKNIYIGVSSKESMKDFDVSFFNDSRKNIYFYDYKTANVWDSKVLGE